MKVNDKICGFSITRIRENEEAGGTLYEMVHDKTGAELVWLDNKDSNRHFSVAFRTPPVDDTGVFHILEHSVLNGSKKYTVKDPFLELIKSSMNTFLNAMTSSDYTIYPVSSRNDQDFFNLVSVYLDAVFCPAIYENPNIFYQEGWHYELTGKDEMPTYKGVVFNEMKGALASPDSQLSVNLGRMIFPDSCYQYVSGGEPSAIPKLSYEEFLETHRKHYHPSNARIYLDGDLQLERILNLIDSEYLSGYERISPDTEIAAQKPVSGVYAEGTYQAEEGEQSYMGFGKILCRYDEKVKRFALNILADYLTGSNDAPLKKAVLSEGLAHEIYMYLDEGSQDQPFITIVKQLDIEREEEFWQVMASVKDELSSTGLDRDELSAIINQVEFAVKDISEPKALGRNMYMLTTWLYGGDPMDGIAFNDVFVELRRLLDTDYFEQLLDEIIWKKEDGAVYVMKPSQTKDEEVLAQEARALEEAKASWNEKDVEELLALNENLVAWQKTENTAEDLATLPTLPLSAVNPEPFDPAAEVRDGILYHSISDNGICHFNLYFSLTGMDEKDYGAISFLTNLFGELPTKRTPLTKLMQRIKGILGHVDYNVASYSKPGDLTLCHPYFVVTFSVLERNLKEAAELVCEIINETDFDSEDSQFLIENILNQCVYVMQDNIMSSGNRFAVLKAASHMSASSKATELFEGYGFYEWLKAFDENLEDAYEDFLALVKRIQKEIFTAGNLTISVAGENTGDTAEILKGLLTKDEMKSYPEYVTLEASEDVKTEAIQIPGGVSYACLVDDLNNHGLAFEGSMSALSRVMTYQYLWNQIRVLGGAYGCGFTISRNGLFMFYSYRDPSPDRSQDVFRNGAAFIREYCESDANFDNIIISAAAAQEPLMSAGRQQNQGDMDYFIGEDIEDRRRRKKQLLETKKEDLLAFCDLLERAGETGHSCTVGPKVHLEIMNIEKVHTL